jgi:hypothetical protein
LLFFLEKKLYLYYVDGRFYLNPANFRELQNKTGESHQHIWNVFVDLDRRAVTSITEEPERVMKETLEPNFVFTGMNMFMPDTVKVNSGSILTCLIILNFLTT